MIELAESDPVSFGRDGEGTGLVSPDEIDEASLLDLVDDDVADHLADAVSAGDGDDEGANEATPSEGSHDGGWEAWSPFAFLGTLRLASDEPEGPSASASWIEQSNSAINGDEMTVTPSAFDGAFSLGILLRVSLANQSNLEPGSVAITVPKQIVRERNNGRWVGKMEMSVPAAPDTRGTFAYSETASSYVLTNTRLIQPGQNPTFRFYITDLNPSKIDGSGNYWTSAWKASVTVNGSAPVASNALYANFVTAASASASKTTHAATTSAWSSSYPPELSPSAQGMGDDSDYIYMKFTSYVTLSGTQPVTGVLSGVASVQNLPSGVPGAIILGTKTPIGTYRNDDWSATFRAPLAELSAPTTPNGGKKWYADTYIAFPKESLEDLPEPMIRLDNAYIATLIDMPQDSDRKTSKSTSNASKRYKETSISSAEGCFFAKANATGVSASTYGLNDLAAGLPTEAPYYFSLLSFGLQSTWEDVNGDGKMQLEEMGRVPYDSYVALGAPEISDVTPEGQSEQSMALKSLAIYDPTMYKWQPFEEEATGYGIDPSAGAITIPAGESGYKATLDGEATIDLFATTDKDACSPGNRIATIHWSGEEAEAEIWRDGVEFSAYDGTLRFDGESGAVRDVVAKVTTSLGGLRWALAPVYEIAATDEVRAAAAAELDRAASPKLYASVQMACYDPAYLLAEPAITSGQIAIEGVTTYVVSKITRSHRNDTANRCVSLSYESRISEQTNISRVDSLREARERGYVPEDTYGIWRILLPSGAAVDMSSLSMSRSADSIQEARLVRDFENNGVRTRRDMLVVKAALSPQYASVNNAAGRFALADEPTLAFDVQYSWASFFEYGGEPECIVAYESSASPFGTAAKYRGEADAVSQTIENSLTSPAVYSSLSAQGIQGALDGLSEREEPGASFVYVRSATALQDIANMSMSGFLKQISNDGRSWESGTGSAGQERVSEVTEGSEYAYSLSYMNDLPDSAEAISGVVLYDPLEQAGDIRGTLVGVDVRALEHAGVRPVIYYSTQSVNMAYDSDRDLSGSKWTTKVPSDKSMIRAIAIDCSKSADGSPFALANEQLVSAEIIMRAPVAQGDLDYFDFDAPAAGQRVARNTAYAVSSASPGSGSPSTTAYGLVPFHVRGEISISDRDDVDGVRPSSVKVELLANGEVMGSPIEVSLPDRDAASQKVGFDLDSIAQAQASDDDGCPIFYTVRVSSADGSPGIDGYDCLVTPIKGQEGFDIKVTLKHAQLTKSISGKKTWSVASAELADEADQARPEEVTIRACNEITGRVARTAYASADSGWGYEIEGLALNEYKAQPIPYRLEETYVPGFVTRYHGYDIENTYAPYGDLRIMNAVVAPASDGDGADGDGGAGSSGEGAYAGFEGLVDASASTPKAAMSQSASYALEVLDADGEPVSGSWDLTIGGKSAGKVSNGESFDVPFGKEAVVSGIPSESAYEIYQELPAGWSSLAIRNAQGQIRAGNGNECAFGSGYASEAKLPFDVFVSLTGRELLGNQFACTLTELDDAYASSRSLVYKGYNQKSGSVPMPSIPFTQADDGRRVAYEIKQVVDEMPGYVLEGGRYVIECTIEDNGDGTLSFEDASITFYDKIGDLGDFIAGADLTSDRTGYGFENSYSATGKAEIDAWVTLRGMDLVDNMLEYELIDGRTGAVVATACNKADGSIPMPAIEFDQRDAGSVRSYTMRQLPNEELAQKAEAPSQGFTYTVSIIDMGDGTLAANRDVAYEDGSPCDVPIFENKAYPGSLTIAKKLDSIDDDPAVEHRFRITLEGADVTGNDWTFDREVTTRRLQSYSAPELAEIADDIAANGEASEHWAAFSQFKENGDTWSYATGDGEKVEFRIVGIGADGAPQKSFSNEADGSDVAGIVMQATAPLSDQMILNGTVRNNWEESELRAYLNDSESGPFAELLSQGVALVDRDGKTKTEDGIWLPSAQEMRDHEVAAEQYGYCWTRDIDSEKMWAVIDSKGNEKRIDKGDKALVLPCFCFGTSNPVKEKRQFVVVSEDDAMMFFCNRPVDEIPEEGDTYRGHSVTHIYDAAYAEGAEPDWYWDYWKAVPGMPSYPMDTFVIEDLFRVDNAFLYFAHMKGEIRGSEKVSTSHARSMTETFYDSDLRGLDLSEWDTSDCVDMSNMFTMSKYERLDLASFDTSKVESASAMFVACSATDIDLSSLTWASNRDASFMFQQCRSLERLKMSCQMPLVESAESMFSGSRALADLDLEADTIDMPLCTTARNMFYQIGLLRFEYRLNIPLASDIGFRMFFYCSNLEKISLRFERPECSPAIESSQNMMYQCSSLISVDLGCLDMTNAASMKGMFQKCSKLESVEWSEIRTGSAVTDMSEVFRECSALKSIDLSPLDSSNVTTFNRMFQDCVALTAIDMRPLDTRSAVDMSYMFDYCESVANLELSRMDTDSVTTMYAMFEWCTELTELDLSRFSTSAAKDMSYMFATCSNLETIYVSGKWSVRNVTADEIMFENCVSLVGGMGTEFDENRTGKAMACIDKHDGKTEGYLSYKDYEEISYPYIPLAAESIHSGGSPLAGHVEERDPESAVLAEGIGGIPTGGEIFEGFAFASLAPCRSAGSDDLTDPSELDYVNSGESDGYCWGLTGDGTFVIYPNPSSSAPGRISGNTGTLASFWPWGKSGISVVKSKAKRIVAYPGLFIVGSARNMFSSFSEVESIDIGNMDMTGITNANSMFRNCSSLKALDLSQMDTRNVTDMTDMLEACETLSEVTFSNGFKLDSCPDSKLPKTPMAWSEEAEEYLDDAKWLGSNRIGYPVDSADLFLAIKAHDAKAAGTWHLATDLYRVRLDKGQLPTGASGEINGPDGDVFEDVEMGADYITPSRPRWYSFGYRTSAWASDDGRSFELGESIGTSLEPLIDANGEVRLAAQWEEDTGNIVVTDNTVEFTLHGGESATFSNIAAGTSYMIEEMSQSGWEQVRAVGATEGKIKPKAESYAEFVNTEVHEIRNFASISGMVFFDGSAQKSREISLFDSAGRLLATVKSTASGTFSFPDQEMAGDMETYYVRQSSMDDEDIAYDIRQYKVEAVVEKGYVVLRMSVSSDAGADEADYESAHSLSFKNATKMRELVLSQQSTGTRHSDAAEFTYRVTTGPGTADYRDVTIKSSTDGAKTIEVHPTHVPTVKLLSCDPGYQVVTEGIESGISWPLGEDGKPAPELSISSAYSASGASAVSLRKEIENGTLAGDDFDFTLSLAEPASGVGSYVRDDVTDGNDASGGIVFPLSYSGSVPDSGVLVETYRVDEEEDVADARWDGIVNMDDQGYREIIVTWSDETHNGTLSPSVEIQGSPVFENAVKTATVTLRRESLDATDAVSAIDPQFGYSIRIDQSAALISPSAMTANASKQDASASQSPSDESVLSLMSLLAPPIANAAEAVPDDGAISGTVTASEANGQTVYLRDGDALVITDVPVRSKVTMTPVSTPAGFNAEPVRTETIPDKGGSVTILARSSYSALGSATLTVEKILDGQAPEDGQFSFIAQQRSPLAALRAIYGQSAVSADDIGADGLEQSSEASNDSDGKVTFALGELTQADSGKYVAYDIFERADDASDGYVMDDKHIHLIAQVADDGIGNIGLRTIRWHYAGEDEPIAASSPVELDAEHEALQADIDGMPTLVNKTLYQIPMTGGWFVLAILIMGTAVFAFALGRSAMSVVRASRERVVEEARRAAMRALR